jgi:hypothetical protein
VARHRGTQGSETFGTQALEIGICGIWHVQFGIPVFQAVYDTPQSAASVQAPLSNHPMRWSLIVR